MRCSVTCASALQLLRTPRVGLCAVRTGSSPCCVLCANKRIPCAAASGVWRAQPLTFPSPVQGKSCLVLRFIRNEYFEDNETTIGAAFLTKTLALDDSTLKMEVRRRDKGIRVLVCWRVGESL